MCFFAFDFGEEIRLTEEVSEKGRYYCLFHTFKVEKQIHLDECTLELVQNEDKHFEIHAKDSQQIIVLNKIPNKVHAQAQIEKYHQKIFS